MVRRSTRRRGSFALIRHDVARLQVMRILIILLCLSSICFAEEPPAAQIPEFHVVGTAVDVPLIPNPRHNPYSSCLVLVEFEVVEGSVSPKAERIVVGLWAFQERKLSPAARWAPGDRISMVLIPFGDADESIQRLQQVSIVEDFELPMFWAVEADKIPKTAS